MSDQENIEESIASPKSKGSLIPKVPQSYSTCKIKTTDGREADLPIL